MNQSTASESFIQKLEAFAGTLTEQEREVLGEILLHAMAPGQTADDVRGYAFSFGTSNLLGASVFGAQSAGKTSTQIFLARGPLGQIHLAAAGPAARQL